MPDGTGDLRRLGSGCTGTRLSWLPALHARCLHVACEESSARVVQAGYCRLDCRRSGPAREAPDTGLAAFAKCRYPFWNDGVQLGRVIDTGRHEHETDTIPVVWLNTIELNTQLAKLGFDRGTQGRWSRCHVGIDLFRLSNESEPQCPDFNCQIYSRMRIFVTTSPGIFLHCPSAKHPRGSSELTNRRALAVPP